LEFGKDTVHSFDPGYPEDLRSTAQRLKAAKSVFADFEQAAARVVARFTGERVVLQDDNRLAKTADLRIDYSDGRLAVVEVVIDTDPRHAELVEQVARRSFAIPAAVPLTRIWFASVTARCNFKRLERELPPLLAQLESDGEYLFEMYMEPQQLAVMTSPLVAKLVDLGVLTINSAPAQEEPPTKIRITPEGMGGPIDVPWEVFAEDLDGVLRSERLGDVWEKLALAEADERHLFLGVSHSSRWSINFAVDHHQRELPPEPPRLPHPVSHLWLMPIPLAIRSIAWFPERGWIDLCKHWATP
jgi:hypothetical protein